jgi:hypothetical protein
MNSKKHPWFKFSSTVPYQKVYLVLGHVFFLSFLAGGIIFYKERLLAFDSAYYTFHVIAFQEFFIKHERYITYLTQWMPLLAMEWELPLKSVLISYSVSFTIWFYLIFLLIAHGFRNVEGGLLMALAFGLTMRYKYYAAISEIVFAIALAALLLAWLTRPAASKPDRNPWVHWGVAVLLTGFMFISHPIIIIPVLVFLGYDILYNRKWKDWPNWAFILFLVGAYSIKFLATRSDPYEAGRMDVLGNAKNILLNFREQKIFEILVWYFDTEYAFPFTVFLVVVGITFYQRKYLAALFILAVSLAWFVLNLITYAYLKDKILIMLDGYLALFGLIWATPMFFLLRSQKFKLPAAIVLSALIIFSLHRIYNKHHYFKQRLGYIEQTLDRYVTDEDRKFIVPPNLFDWDRMWYPYEIPHESLMLSALQGPEHAATLFVNIEYRPLEELQQDSTVFLQFSNPIPIKKLPQQYFQLPNKTYTVIEEVDW